MSKVEEGAKNEAAWNALMATYRTKYPKEAAEFDGLLSCKLPEGWANALPTFTPEDAGIATRQHSQTMLNALAPVLPGMCPAAAAAAAAADAWCCGLLFPV
jgi:transketolase